MFEPAAIKSHHVEPKINALQFPGNDVLPGALTEVVWE